ncbi:MAG: bifunctional 5,10-methylenetetrahydrofolate dehydrogenase/5,10-methenyltetrahydrofolate cyclohydrolase [Patescibacteria group bacterium]
MIIDGKKIADGVLAEIGESLRGTTLGVVMVGGDTATESFVKIKTRVAERLGVEIKRFDPTEFAHAIKCDGVIIQMPIPNADELIAALPPAKDVDGLTSHSIVRPPVAEAISEILSRSNVFAQEKKAAVVGAGKLVGLPAAALLRELGADVVVVTQTRGSLEELKDADIVVCGAGEPGLIKPAMLKLGVVLIDAGTSEAGGKLAGDADPACAEVAGVFTPVPGGVGPIAVAMIFKNLQALVARANGK